MIVDVALSRALPELRARELKLRGLAAQAGITYDVADYGGIRTQADTTQILAYRDADYAVYVRNAKAAGKVPVSKDAFRPIAPFGSSFHNYGAAFDARILTAPAGMSHDDALTKLGGLGGLAGLVWGGLWAYPKTDRPHFQLATGLTQAKEMWDQFQRGETPTAPASSSDAASILAGSLPGVQVIGQRVAVVPPPRTTAATRVASVVRRAPLATTAVSTGALLAAGLFLWLAVRRYLED